MSDAHDDDGAERKKGGYKNPPKHTQFPKGQSGNLKGRPKGAKGFAASLKRELEAKVAVRKGNRTVMLSKAEAAAMRLVEKALKGDMAALRMLASIDAGLSQEVAEKAEAETASRELAQDDEEILSHFFDLARDSAGGPDDEDEN